MTDRRDNAPPPDGWRPIPHRMDAGTYETPAPEIPENITLSDN
jgi:hypothetical protein